MAKGYWIARLAIGDQDAYDRYRARNGAAIARFGGRFLVRGGPFRVGKGEGRQHNVLIEFPSLEAAQHCFDSPEYQAALEHLKETGPGDFIIIGGYDGPQPVED